MKQPRDDATWEDALVKALRARLRVDEAAGEAVALIGGGDDTVLRVRIAHGSQLATFDLAVGDDRDGLAYLRDLDPDEAAFEIWVLIIEA